MADLKNKLQAVNIKKNKLLTINEHRFKSIHGYHSEPEPGLLLLVHPEQYHYGAANSLS